MGRCYPVWIRAGPQGSQNIAVGQPCRQTDAVRSWFSHTKTTETSPQDDRYVMTCTQAPGYFQIVMKGLQHTNAFVIQFRRSIDPRADRLPGRVEHVASGRTATFESIEELPQVLQKMLKSVTSEDAGWPE